jgi:DNA-binding CsgD family transcriptional regulator
MERSLWIGREANLPWAIAGTLANLAQTLGELYQFEDAALYLTEGLVYAIEHDDDYHLQEMLTWQALARLHQGYWTEANETLLKVLQRPNRDLLTYTYALLTLGRLRVRLGEAGALAMLDEGLALSIQVGVARLENARAARAELAWLAGDHERAIEEARAVYDIAVGKEHPWIVGELAFWRWRAGDSFTPPAWIGKPFALQIAGDWRGAADEWEGRGCPYEQALALMDGDEAAQLVALGIFERLGARPALERLKQRMRSQGIRGIPRGPRPRTRENPFGLTTRELEVLASLRAGLNNQAIAKKLTLSTRTVEHHITSILQKMQVQSRNEAVALALKENLLLPE